MKKALIIAVLLPLVVFAQEPEQKTLEQASCLELKSSLFDLTQAQEQLRQRFLVIGQEAEKKCSATPTPIPTHTPTPSPTAKGGSPVTLPK